MKRIKDIGDKGKRVTNADLYSYNRINNGQCIQAGTGHRPERSVSYDRGIL